MNWEAENEKSRLACALLELIRICFKDLRYPDFKEETYNQVEMTLCELLENIDSPALKHYHQEILQICNQMIIVKKEVTPILSDIMHELINVAEESG